MTDRLDVHVYFHLSSHQDSGGTALDQKLSLILARLGAIQAQEQIIMTDLTKLTTQVEETTTIEKSAVVLIEGIAQKLADAGTDPGKLQALQDALKSNSDALAAAVTANTPPAA